MAALAKQFESQSPKVKGDRRKYLQKQKTERKRELDIEVDMNEREVDFDTPVQPPKLDRLRKGSSHRKTQAR